MVMKRMREHTKAFLVFLVLAFVGTIIFSWGMDVTGIKHRPNVLGEVAGKEIRLQQYYQALQNRIDSYRQRTNKDLTDAELKQLQNQTWEAMVQQILLGKEIKKRGIVVTDQEILYNLQHNPPQELRQNKSFQTNGKFDMNKYYQAMQNPQNDQFWMGVEDYLRSYLPYQKLQDMISSSVIVSNEEVRWEFIKKNEKAKVKYIYFSPTKFIDTPITVTDQEIKAYYKSHKDDYKEPETRKIKYVIFPVKPTASDTAAIYAEANRIIKKLKNGADFAEMASTFSDDAGSAQKGGDLGYFGKGVMVKEFEKAAFSAKVGQIVGPIKSSFGLHIIKVEDRKYENGKLKIRARHILLKFEPSEETKDSVKGKAAYFASNAKEEGFDRVAKQDTTIHVKESPYFRRGGFIPGIGFNQDIAKFVFKNKPGAISETPFETNQGYVVVEVASVKKKHIKPLDEVKNQIQNILLQKKRKEKAGQWAAAERAKMHKPEDFELVAAKDSLTIKEAGPFTMDGFVSGVGNDPDFKGAAFHLNVNEISQPVETVKGYYLIKLLEKTSFDQKQFALQKDLIRQQLLQKKRQQAFTEWYSQLKAEAKIKDYRDQVL
ncbi:MAG: hypothetical protein GXO76_08525 [Calditrichaeota bacterium]|nr:hypothetical protein [Calditrichota bacterium]